MKYIKPIVTFCIMLVAGYMSNSCRKDEQIPQPVTTVLYTDPVVTGVKGFYLLNEGNMGSNKASLDFFDYKDGTYYKNIFGANNPTIVRGLGDVGNDIRIYGSRLYAVINCSNLVEVMTVKNARHITKFTVPNARYITFRDGMAYVSAYVAPVELSPAAQRGAVFEYDTVTYQKRREVVVGYQPEEMAIVGDKMYVANSGGYRFPDYDNTISVIDLNTFKVVKTIEVGINLHRIKADRYGDLYVTSRGDYYDIPSNLYVIDTRTDQVKKSFGIPASNICRSGDSLYIYSTEWSYNTEKNAVTYALIDTRTEEVISRSFITDGTDQNIRIPYGLAVHPLTKEIFVTDAGNYVSPGTLYCFSPGGKKIWEVTTGDIPAHIAFVMDIKDDDDNQ